MSRVFTLDQITKIRAIRAKGMSMRALCYAYAQKHSRDEMVEAVWATLRFAEDYRATRHVNDVLAHQAQKVPLINGRPQRFHQVPMFT